VKCQGRLYKRTAPSKDDSRNTI